MSDLEELLGELAADVNFRRAFAETPAAVLRARGYDPNAFTVPETIDLAALEARLQVWVAAQQTGSQSPLAAISNPAPAPDEGQRLSSRLRRTSATSGAEAGSFVPGILQHTRAIPPFASHDGELAAADITVEPGDNAVVITEAGELQQSLLETGDTAYPSAWYGSNGTAVSRVLIAGPETARLIPEAVIGSDDRIEVRQGNELPFRWLCRLVIQAANGTLWSGTGWLVGQHLVMTAGHCVYMQNQGGWAHRIQVFLFNEDGELGQPIEAENAASVAGWVQGADPEQDYAVISLPKDSPAPGWFGFGSFEDKSLARVIGNITGFPVDKPVGSLWGHARRISEVRQNVLIYDIDTYGGMSGAPVICWNGQDYIVIGIHNYGDLSGNRATRINTTVCENIEAWLTVFA